MPSDEVPAGANPELPENHPAQTARVLKALAMAIFICCEIVYVFITSQKEEVAWAGVARLV